jgi:hypothetical protein
MATRAFDVTSLFADALIEDEENETKKVIAKANTIMPTSIATLNSTNEKPS